MTEGEDRKKAGQERALRRTSEDWIREAVVGARQALEQKGWWSMNDARRTAGAPYRVDGERAHPSAAGAITTRIKKELDTPLLIGQDPAIRKEQQGRPCGMWARDKER